MALSVVLGSSGSGKSTYIYNKILEEAAQNRDKNYLVIVPEQYTMSTQRLLVKMQKNHCIMNVDVLSFNRLAYRVFEELGITVLDVLDDVGKSLVLRKLVNDHLDELTALKKNITRISYIAQVKSLISEMTQYNITPDVLKEMISFGPMSESFRRKAGDLLVLYEAFLDFSQGRYITAEAILSELNGVLADSKICSGATVVIDGFTGFTPIQYELVGTMLSVCDQVYVTVTGDTEENYVEQKDDDDLFAMSAEFIQKLASIARYKNVDFNDPIKIDDTNGRLKDNEVLGFLEKNIFRNTKAEYAGGTKAGEALSLVSLKNTRQELTYVAMEIDRAVKSEGKLYRDFAVVCPNLEQYRYLAKDIFSSYNIPFFVDANSEIVFNPFLELISAVFEIYDTGFSKESVMHFLRTGFTDLTREEIDYLENYIIATGVRGTKKYFHPFAIRSNTFKADEDLLKVNAIREKFMDPFKDLYSALDNATTTRTIAVALYNFIAYFDCERKLKERGKLHEKEGRLVLAKEYEQIYKQVMMLIDKMVAILGDEPMTLEEFSDIFEAGMSAASIGVLPPTNDSVIIGDMERTRLDDIKVLFLIGASDDSIPKKVENGGILSQLEREQLLEKFEMAPSDRQKSFRQRFYLYMILTKPMERLVVTSPRVDGSGKAANMSYLFEIFKKMYGIEPAILEEFELSSRLQSRSGATDLLVELLQKASNEAIELTDDEKATLERLISWAVQEEGLDFNQLLDTVFFYHTGENVSKEVMLAVNEAFNEDETVSGSVSKFECYSDCAYKYFLRYILKLNEREEAELSPIDMGNFYHEALERYSALLKNDNKKWSTISEEESATYIDAAIQQTYQGMFKVSTLEDPTQVYIVDTMKKTLSFTVGVITEQVKRSAFEPEAFEEEIKTTINNSGEAVANLKGKVDRIDLTEGESRAVRVIDYKSSAHKIDFDECLYGLSLQLPIYMTVVLDKLAKAHPESEFYPSALLYYKMDNPFVSTEDSEESLREVRLKSSRLDGLISDREFLDNDLTLDTENTTSSVVPIKVSVKDGISPDKRSSHLIEEKALDILLEYSTFKAGKIAEDILEGKFDAAPAKLKSNSACTFCSYNSVCHFDENTEGFDFRELESRGAEAIGDMKRLMGKEEGEE